MIRQSTDGLVEYCRTGVGDRLRTVTRYSLDEFDSVYIREGILAEVGVEDEASWGMFRLPIFQLHRRLWDVSQYASTLGDPELVRYSFGDVDVVQLVLSEESGIWISFDSVDEIPGDFVPGLRAFVSAG